MIDAENRGRGRRGVYLLISWYASCRVKAFGHDHTWQAPCTKPGVHYPLGGSSSAAGHASC